MNPQAVEREQQLLACLDEVMDASPSERTALVRAKLGDDPSLMRDLERLLIAVEQPDETYLAESVDGFLQPVLEDLADNSDTGGDVPAALVAALEPRYTIQERIGRGGMASVYLAFDTTLGRHVAIKSLRPELADSISLERFQREITIAATIDHPCVVSVYDRGSADGLLYYIMPYVAGGSLRDLLLEQPQLEIRRTIDIARNVAQALDAAHARKIVHRDIKPANILLDEHRAYVADFGVARLLDVAGRENLTRTGTALGTTLYMSPEQVSSPTKVDGRCDVYALACVLYEMLAGEAPFTGPTQREIMAKHLAAAIPDLTVVRPTITRPMQQALATALNKAPTDRFATAGEFIDAFERAWLSPNDSSIRSTEVAVVSARRRRAIQWGVASLGIAALLVAWQPWRSFVDRTPLDGDRVAVAPFDLLGVSDTVWRNGLVDVFARNFDGAGPLRTVSASAAIREWRGRSDPASAEALGRRTGAALVIFGQLHGTGGDTVRLQVTTLDVRRRRTLADVEVSGSAQRVVLLADSVTILTLRELNRSRAITAVARASLGSTSLPALKLFLQGEQLLRRNNLPAARDAYARTIGQDSSFALGYRRMRSVLRALGLQSEFDSVSYWYALRAGALNHALSPRDSLLIVADSLLAALPGVTAFYTVADLNRLRRRFDALETGAVRYPDDAEIWYELAEARHHFGERTGVSQRVVLDAFSRAISLDPEFAPAYYHAVELALTLDGPAAARQLVSQYLSHVNAADVRYRILEGLLDPAQRSTKSIQTLVDSTDGASLFDTYYLLRRWPDSAQLAVRFYESMARRPAGRTAEDSSRGRWWMSYALILRGRLHEALASRHATETTVNLVELALRGVVPPDSARTIFAEWLKGPDPRLVLAALAWWGAQHDTLSLSRATRRFATLAASAPPSAEATIGAVGVRAAEAYQRLVRADTAGAIMQFAAIPDSLCPLGCLHQRLTHARLLLAVGRAAQAAAVLDRHPPSASSTYIGEALWTFERGRAALLTGDRRRARIHFESITQSWDSADPELRLMIAEAHHGLTAPPP